MLFLQVAIGWSNSHLHQFEVNGVFYSDTRNHHAEFEGDPEILEESKLTLAEVAAHQGDTFGDEYDFSDSWKHQVRIEKILPLSAVVAA